MSGLGAAMAGGNGDREEDDFYSTPREVTEALLIAAHKSIRNVGTKVWEPACGTGAMVEPLLDAGFEVLATDLVDRGYGTGGIDFLKTGGGWCDIIITNPPFKDAGKFINHAEAIGVRFMALLLKATFWHAATRLPLFERWRPACVLPLTWRVDFKNLGNATMDLSWYVWSPNRADERTCYMPLPRPKRGGSAYTA